MQRLILTYGAIAGTIVIALLVLTMAIGTHGGVLGMVLGYLSMLIAMSMVFAGVKRFRDEHQGGVIRFWKALGIGLGIAAVASAFYVLGWELYMWATDYRFMTEYSASVVAQKTAAGASPAELAALKAQMADFAAMYANPVYRMLMTLSEIAPVAVLMPLIAAAVLRRPGALPARG